MIVFIFVNVQSCVEDDGLLKSGMVTDTLRERNKSDKLRRITTAARTLFDTRGFDATATRDIAAAAKVGLSTLFLYASDKRDLLFLACNDDLEALTERAFADVDPDATILDQLLGAFQLFFEFYGRDRRLSRDLLRELTFYTSGQQSARFQATRRDTIARIAQLITTARARGAVMGDSSDCEIAQVVFYVFAAEVRHWLGGDNIAVGQGVDHFARLLRVVLTGFQRSS